MSAMEKNFNPVLKAFLEGVYDQECVLFKLNGFWHLLGKICKKHDQFEIKNINLIKEIRFYI